MVAISWSLLLSQLGYCGGSFTDLNVEYGEQKLALQGLVAENNLLRQSLSDNARTLTEIRGQLSEAIKDAATLKAQIAHMRLRTEAFGVSTGNGGNAFVEQRLLTAVNQIRAGVLENSSLSQALVRLVEASSLYLKTTTVGASESRTSLELEVRNSREALGAKVVESKKEGKQASPGYQRGGRVVSVKEDLALIVADLGTSSGIRLGMPLDVIRNEQPIGSARVVDVREGIMGAVIQHLNSEKNRIQVGDNLKVASEQ